jgi:hypothetical protein
VEAESSAGEIFVDTWIYILAIRIPLSF